MVHQPQEASFCAIQGQYLFHGHHLCAGIIAEIQIKKTKSRETAEKIYSRLPVSVAHYIGSLTRKYISL
jgi:hypothetical protein